MYKRLAVPAAKRRRVSSPVGPESSQTLLVSASAAAKPVENPGRINTLNQDILGCIAKCLSSNDRGELSATSKGIRDEVGLGTVRLTIKRGCSNEKIRSILNTGVVVGNIQTGQTFHG